MLIIKKLAFAPLFLTSLFFCLNALRLIFNVPNLIFSFDWETFISLITFALSLNMAAIFFSVFATLVDDYIYILPVVFLGATMSFIFFFTPINLVMIVGIVVAFLLGYWSLHQKLKSYLTFSAPAILASPAKQMALLMIIFISVGYFILTSMTISQTGFQVPDGLVDTAVNLTPMPEVQTESGSSPLNNLPISKEQIAELKKNPQLLKQYGLDPKILDSLDAPTKAASNVSSNLKEQIKQTVKTQIDQAVKPYQQFIPYIYAFLIFFTLTSLSSFLSIFYWPLLWLIFYILENTGFIHFDKEMREVKKLVI